MMKRLFNPLLVFGLFLSLSSFNANASNQYSTQVKEIHSWQCPTGTSCGSADLTYIVVANTTRSTPLPTCAANSTNASVIWVVDENSSTAARNQMNIITMALAQGRTISIIGSGTCVSTNYPATSAAYEVIGEISVQ